MAVDALKKLPTSEGDPKVAEKEAVAMGLAHEIAQIRRALREMLLADRYDGATEVLGRFSQIAAHDGELEKEYERWQKRVEILAAPKPALI